MGQNFFKMFLLTIFAKYSKIPNCSMTKPMFSHIKRVSIIVCIFSSIFADKSLGQCPLKINYDAAGNRVYRGTSCDANCSLLVTNTLDDGPGSLRKAILCAADGDTILFTAALTNQFISLTSGSIPVNKGIKILQTSGTRIKVIADNEGPTLDISSGNTEMRYISLYGSDEVGKEGRALINCAQLLLENVELYDQETLVGLGTTFTNHGQLQILGQTKIIVLPSF